MRFSQKLMGHPSETDGTSSEILTETDGTSTHRN